MLFVKLLVQVLCAGARDTLFWRVGLLSVVNMRVHSVAVPTQSCVEYNQQAVCHKMYRSEPQSSFLYTFFRDLSESFTEFRLATSQACLGNWNLHLVTNVDPNLRLHL